MSPRVLFCLALLPSLTYGQTTHTVLVGGSTSGGTPPFYAPSSLTIEQGDIVTWQNVSGTHNVNGTTTFYPANPEGFFSGSPQGGSWTFSHTFTIPGTYNYRCTQPGHSATQSGTIVVNPGSTSVQEVEITDIVLSPVPTGELLTIGFGTMEVQQVEVITLDGKKVIERGVNGETQLVLPVHSLSSGQYFVRLVGRDGRATVRPFRKA